MAKTLQTQALPSESVSYELISVISSHNKCVFHLLCVIFFRISKLGIDMSRWSFSFIDSVPSAMSKISSTSKPCRTKNENELVASQSLEGLEAHSLE